jgi:AAA+ ATPase superfamily predicted ATPase
MSFMENQVLGYQSPLYGRRTAQFKILPFSFFEALPFLNGFKDTDKAILYGVTGGVPEYLSKINSNKTVRENIIDLFLTNSGHFFEEPFNLLKQELREPAVYNVIIESIANGASRLNEISTKANIESGKCAKYLSSLISLGLVSKEFPYGETTGKRCVYKLNDNMFRFWYRFVFPSISAVTAGLGQLVYDNDVESQLNAYMGLVFEDICKQWFFEIARKSMEFPNCGGKDSLPFFIGGAGRWWGTNSKTKKQEEIDIMAVKAENALYGECKWTNSDVDTDVFYNLKRRSELFQYKNVFLYIFAREGFTNKLYELERGGFVKLHTLSNLIESVSAEN